MRQGQREKPALIFPYHQMARAYARHPQVGRGTLICVGWGIAFSTPLNLFYRSRVFSSLLISFFFNQNQKQAVVLMFRTI
jgi:hypothetical protein